jgi:hypothetical protein
MDREHDYWTIEAMRSQGGSFVKALGKAATYADPINLRLIKNTWPQYWEQYHRAGQKLRFKACKFGECDGSGEIDLDQDQDDGEGHTMVATGTGMCRCRFQ